ncbi:hypothetical protein B0H63DRAFT_102462 [Podospora didyma]|uniref:SH3 domain-containing protein n=1 Tax=Podospora didyma TaxID=330526 RepID=A0AAE0U3L5_9PEZI|nr:hypothetical protein B0H63DRAFT_102462 [Podospora didyma]
MRLFNPHAAAAAPAIEGRQINVLWDRIVSSLASVGSDVLGPDVPTPEPSATKNDPPPVASTPAVNKPTPSTPGDKPTPTPTPPTVPATNAEVPPVVIRTTTRVVAQTSAAAAPAKETPIEQPKAQEQDTTVVVQAPTPSPSPSPSPVENLETDTNTTPVANVNTDPATPLPPAVVPSSGLSLPNTLDVAPTSVAGAPVATSRSSIATRTGAAKTSSATRSAVTTSSSAQSGGSNGETSAGAKAGIAIGVLAGILLAFVGAWFLFNRRKRRIAAARRRRRSPIDDDEKISPFADSAAIRTPTKAPRLSLRPVTQFLPNLGSSAPPERRASRGIALSLATPSVETTQNRGAGANSWERPVAGTALNNSRPGTSASLNPANPFNDAQRIPEDSSKDLPVSPVSSVAGDDYMTTAESTPEPVSPIGGDSVNSKTAAAVGGAAAGAVAAGAAGAALSRKGSMRKDHGKPLDLTMQPPMSTIPPSPTGTVFSMHSVAPGQQPGPSASAAAIAAAGGPPQSAVHRVQLDFRPTLEDEMGLVAGQLVRLLHEYDDGWALCIRLDRSQQGVVPRTCLSTRPVKPRPGPGAPRGPPVNPNRGPGHPSQRVMNGGQQGYPPNGQHQRPPQSRMPMQGQGYGRPHSPGGRPVSPYGVHPESPANRSHQQQGRPRSPHSSNGGRGPSPPGQGHMQRSASPVQAPGQAY